VLQPRMTTKENPLAAAAGSPGPGQAQACFCGSGRRVVRRRRATRWLRCVTRREGGAVSGTSWLGIDSAAGYRC
jgi:hypothetical protein